MAVDIVINKKEKEIRNTRPENSLKNPRFAKHVIYLRTPRHYSDDCGQSIFQLGVDDEAAQPIPTDDQKTLGTSGPICSKTRTKTLKNQ
jgi:hypothetical protein